VGIENNRNVNTRKQNGCFVTTLYEIQTFCVAFEMFLKLVINFFKSTGVHLFLCCKCRINVKLFRCVFEGNLLVMGPNTLKFPLISFKFIYFVLF
jgi:hypothetical protein